MIKGNVKEQWVLREKGAEALFGLLAFVIACVCAPFVIGIMLIAGRDRKK